MGPASERGIDHKPGPDDFTDNWRHESQTLRSKPAASRFWQDFGRVAALINKKRKSWDLRDLDFRNQNSKTRQNHKRGARKESENI
jgi:hypothetical protein